MTLRGILLGIGGLSVTALILGYVLALAEEDGTARASRTTVALAGAPFVLRDGRRAIADVVQVAFEPKAAGLSEETQEPLQALLGRMARGCVLSAQVVGVASEFETAPRPVVDAHLLALERADAITRLVRDSGVPPTAVSSLWAVDRELQMPHSIIWVFSSTSRSACVEPAASVELAAMSVDSATDAGPASNPASNPASKMTVPPPMPQRDRSADAEATADLPPAAPASVGELALTFANNSSYLDDQAIARLRRFAGSLGPACAVTLKATVAGGANAHYASWLAERRVARVADQLSELATIENHILVRDDASRRVVVAISDESACTAAQETTSVMNAQL